MKLHSLTIHRYAGFEECPRLEFSEGHNIIIGKNGTGKTHLLNLVCMIAGQPSHSRLLFDPKNAYRFEVLPSDVDTSDSPVVIDDMGDGLHPELIEKRLRDLDNRQTFIATHNKHVIDAVNYGDPDDLRRKIIICLSLDDGKRMVGQLDEDTARHVFEQIDIGIMSPSDVLRAEGIW